MSLEWIAIGLSIFALGISILAVYYRREKTKLTRESVKQQKYDSWLRSISPEPHINIFDGKLGYIRKHSKLGDETEEIIGAVIKAIIGNCYGTAIEPKWVYRVNFKNGESYFGKWSDKGISMQVGITHNKISFIPSESQRFYLESDVLELKDLLDMKSLDSIEIWIEYKGRQDVLYNSYKPFKLVNGEWTDENQRTKVWRVKSRQNTKK